MGKKTPPLLPSGFGDVLPHAAEQRRHISTRIMDCFSRLGYAEVSPPLVEFEESLLAAGVGKALAHNTFRLMDPMTQRMLAVRADMTAQIARLAQHRFPHAPRPLRLSYTGEVLRIKADRTSPERQARQLGVELIGAETLVDDGEVALVAVTALTEAGVANLSIDLCSPRLFDALVHGDPAQKIKLQAAVAAKDMDAVKAIPHANQGMLLALLGIPLLAEGARKQTLTKLSTSKDLPEVAREMLAGLMELAELLTATAPHVRVTIDPLEQRGFDYHEGMGFALFSPNMRGELGRGGRYRSGEKNGTLSTGVSLYLERVLQAIPPATAPDVVYVPKEYGFSAWLDLARGGTRAVMGRVASADEKVVAAATTSIFSPSKKK